MITLVSKQEKFFRTIVFFHPRSVVHRFYLQRKKGGRGLKSVELWLEGRIIAIRQHQDKKSNDTISNSRRAISNTWSRKRNSG